MTGSFLQGSQIQITDVVSNLIALQNVGIAAVTPADKLYEILFSNEMVKLRKETQKNLPPSSAEPSNPPKAD
jgi:hypothetical protein